MADAKISAFTSYSAPLLATDVVPIVDVTNTTTKKITVAKLMGVQMIRQHADRAAFTSNTSQQAIFDSASSGAITLATGAYTFEGIIQCKTMSATSGNLKFSLNSGGTATIANILYIAQGIDAANDTSTAFSGVAEIIATQTAASLATGATATVLTFFVKGSFECTVTGTIIPSVAQTTANAAVITAGSFMVFNLFGTTTTVSV